MVPTYNGWEDSPEDERETLELCEAASETTLLLPRRSRASVAGVTIDLNPAA